MPKSAWQNAECSWPNKLSFAALDNPAIFSRTRSLAQRMFSFTCSTIVGVMRNTYFGLYGCTTHCTILQNCYQRSHTLTR